MQFIKVDLQSDKHCEALLGLLNQYMLDDFGIKKAMPADLGPKIVDGLKKHTAYLGFFVQIDNEMAALANCNLVFSTWKAKPVINIHDFIVSEKFRRRGVGLFLLKGIENYALEMGYCRLNLEVRYDNVKAQELYKKAGFTECDPSNYFWEKKMI